MKNFNRDSGFNYKKGGGTKDGKRGGFGRKDRGTDRPEMHRATCAECGASCEVPFKPISGKPVLCSLCFHGKEEPSPRRFNRDKGFKNEQTGNISQEQFEILNAKLDKILRALE